MWEVRGVNDAIWNLWSTPDDASTKLLVAFLCGLALGIEREAREKAAGLRTIVLISVGSALYLMVGEAASLSAAGEAAASSVTPDPTRIGSEVVAGVGFLGAGSIIQSRGAVHGLTTAATIWVAAAVGLSAGVGMYGVAVTTTLAVLLSLIFLDPLADWFRTLGKKDSSRLTFTSPAENLTVTRIELLLREHGADRTAIARSPLPESRMGWEVQVQMRSVDQLRLLESLSGVSGVRGHDEPVIDEPIRS